MERPPEDDERRESGPDLLSVALVVFFVSLIGIVVALLVSTAIF